MTGSGQVQEATYAARKAEFEGRKVMTNWIGGGVLGLSLIAIGELTTQTLGKRAPSVFPPLLMTLIFFAAVAVAETRVEFAWAATKLEDEQVAAQAADTANLPASLKWPRRAEATYYLSIVLLIVAALVYLIGMWWSA